MAIFSAHLKTITRSNGHSCVAAAAYRAGENIEDRETGEVHDYTKKQGIVHDEIVAPSSIEVPDSFYDRSELWNTSTATNTHKKGVMARELVAALPHELTEQERIDLSVGFSQWVSDRQQIMCDVVIHEPSSDGDDRNHHMHLMMGANIVTEDGLQKAKSHVVDGKRVRSIVFDEGGYLGSEELKIFRSELCENMNEALESGGYDVRVDERSYMEQELDKIPTIHLGKHATQLERNGTETELGSYNRHVIEWNQVQEILTHHEITFDPVANDNEWLPDVLNTAQPEQQQDQSHVIDFMPYANMAYLQAEEKEQEPQKSIVWEAIQERYASVTEWFKEYTENTLYHWQHLQSYEEQYAEEERQEQEKQEQEQEEAFYTEQRMIHHYENEREEIQQEEIKEQQQSLSL